MVSIFNEVLPVNLMHSNKRPAIPFTLGVGIDPTFERMPFERTESVIEIGFPFVGACDFSHANVSGADQLQAGRDALLDPGKNSQR